MNDYVFESMGEGNFAITGSMTFGTVTRILEESKQQFDEHPVITIDLAGVTEGDSAGLALLLEWVNWAKYYVHEIRYKNIPAQIQSIAEISEVDQMLQAGERWLAPAPKNQGSD